MDSASFVSLKLQFQNDFTAFCYFCAKFSYSEKLKDWVWQVGLSGRDLNSAIENAT